jgi:hypothetical protein
LGVKRPAFDRFIRSLTSSNLDADHPPFGIEIKHNASSDHVLLIKKA